MANYDPYGQEILGLERQREFARKLREQADQPLQGQMVSGYYVSPSWTQYAANALRSYLGAKGESKAEEALRGVESRRKQERDSWMGEMPKAGQVEVPADYAQFDPTDIVQGLRNVENRQPKTEDYLAWATRGMNIDPAAAQMGMKYGDVSLGREAQAAAVKQAQEQRAMELQQRLAAEKERAQERMDFQRQMQDSQNQSRRDIAAMTAANRPEPLQTVMGKDGPVLVPRSQAVGMQPWTPKMQDAATAKDQAALSAQQTLNQAQLLFAHPGRELGTGSSSWVGSVPFVANKAKDFQAQLDTFKAQTFVPMVSALKGMGALSDAEGRKLSESVGALRPDMTEKEFSDSLKTVAKTLYDKAVASGLNVQKPDFIVEQPQTAPANDLAAQARAERERRQRGR